MKEYARMEPDLWCPKCGARGMVRCVMPEVLCRRCGARGGMPRCCARGVVPVVWCPRCGARGLELLEMCIVFVTYGLCRIDSDNYCANDRTTT